MANLSSPTTHTPSRPFDRRTFAIMAIALLVGAAWGYYNFASTGGARAEAQVPNLVWAIFATPFALCIGWVLARRREWGTAAFACFCLYFFTPFVAAQFQNMFLARDDAWATGNPIYFPTVIVIHMVAGVALSFWRAVNGENQEPRTKNQEPRTIA
ncbi:MAG: hypothetical protein MUD01_17415 [Chloroflexaceae bacterium]|nr:hypothetical protein [Chloroflexaceae bacterium]